MSEHTLEEAAFFLSVLVTPERRGPQTETDVVKTITAHVVATLKERAAAAEPTPKDRARIKARLVLEALGLTEHWRSKTEHEADRAVFDFIDRAVLAYADPERRR